MRTPPNVKGVFRVKFAARPGSTAPGSIGPVHTAILKMVPHRSRRHRGNACVGIMPHVRTSSGRLTGWRTGDSGDLFLVVFTFLLFFLWIVQPWSPAGEGERGSARLAHVTGVSMRLYWGRAFITAIYEYIHDLFLLIFVFVTSVVFFHGSNGGRCFFLFYYFFGLMAFKAGLSLPLLDLALT
ncbi:hypothetical protein E2C01_038559 [Portunus trituberculatus]|uniref:Uncharacterized protein n=1 Tax=Portunus trituberculatus TaxID=210409 RepID=A0A5B7FIV4_PORTR|nr:hypothetical protein [Portunus trituberculatus]